MLSVLSDEHFMRLALQEAEKAFERSEVPVGAIITCQNQVIAKGHNLTEQLTDVTAHAEMLCLTAASEHLGSKYLNECTLYVTLEPCPMCAGALAWSQIGRIVYGAYDEKRGYARLSPNVLHPRTTVTHGILEAECRGLMLAFFENKRK